MKGRPFWRTRSGDFDVRVFEGLVLACAPGIVLVAIIVKVLG